MSNSFSSRAFRMDSSSFLPSEKVMVDDCLSFIDGDCLFPHDQTYGLTGIQFGQIQDSLTILKNHGIAPVHDPDGVVVDNPYFLLFQKIFLHRDALLDSALYAVGIFL